MIKCSYGHHQTKVNQTKETREKKTWISFIIWHFFCLLLSLLSIDLEWEKKEDDTTIVFSFRMTYEISNHLLSKCMHVCGPKVFYEITIKKNNFLARKKNNWPKQTECERRKIWPRKNISDQITFLMMSFMN